MAALQRLHTAFAVFVCLFAIACGQRFQSSTFDPCATDNGDCSANASCEANGAVAVCKCLPGFLGDGKTCTDVNECETDNGNCPEGATCENTPGTYTCTCGKGWTGDGTACADIDECATGLANCDPTSDLS